MPLRLSINRVGRLTSATLAAIARDAVCGGTTRSFFTIRPGDHKVSEPEPLARDGTNNARTIFHARRIRLRVGLQPGSGGFFFSPWDRQGFLPAGEPPHHGLTRLVFDLAKRAAVASRLSRFAIGSHSSTGSHTVAFWCGGEASVKTKPHSARRILLSVSSRESPLYKAYNDIVIRLLSLRNGHATPHVQKKYERLKTPF